MEKTQICQQARWAQRAAVNLERKGNAALRDHPCGHYAIQDAQKSTSMMLHPKLILGHWIDTWPQRQSASWPRGAFLCTQRCKAHAGCTRAGRTALRSPQSLSSNGISIVTLHIAKTQGAAQLVQQWGCRHGLSKARRVVFEPWMWCPLQVWSSGLQDSKLGFEGDHGT